MGWLNSLKSRRRERFESVTDGEDFLLVTWDSCRYDTYLKANKPVMDAYGPARRGWAMGTYTLPSHVSMFQGALPHVFSKEPFYNRFCQQLWHIGHRRLQVKPLVTFAPHTPNVLHGFRQRGYYTVGAGAMTWFEDSTPLRDGFDDFHFTGPGARKQNKRLIAEIEENAAHRNCFAFVNYGETHSPFEYEDMPTPSPKIKEQFGWRHLLNQEGRVDTGWTFGSEAFEQQVRCAEFLDARTGELIEFFRNRGRPTTIVLCGDHGECFGENGVYGHGVYHEKVMEVPPPHLPN